MQHERTQYQRRQRNSAIFFALAVLWLMLSANAQGQSDEVSARMGKQSFRVYCASCHGAEAKGDGSVAEYLTIKPADLTKISERNDGEFPSDRVYKIIDGRVPVRGHGRGEMPVWGDSFKMARDTPDEMAIEKKITELVHFLKSIQEE